MARKVVDRGPCETDATTPRLREDRLEGDMDVAADQAIARSSRRRWFSRRSRRITSRSAVLNPSACRPASRSACATQLRIVWAVDQNSRASSSGVRPVRTNSTIWRRKAGGACPRGNGGRSRFRHSGYLLPKGSGVHKNGTTPVTRCSSVCHISSRTLSCPDSGLDGTATCSTSVCFQPSLQILVTDSTASRASLRSKRNRVPPIPNSMRRKSREMSWRTNAAVSSPRSTRICPTPSNRWTAAPPKGMRWILPMLFVSLFHCTRAVFSNIPSALMCPTDVRAPPMSSVTVMWSRAPLLMTPHPTLTASRTRPGFARPSWAMNAERTEKNLCPAITSSLAFGLLHAVLSSSTSCVVASGAVRHPCSASTRSVPTVASFMPSARIFLPVIPFLRTMIESGVRMS